MTTRRENDLREDAIAALIADYEHAKAHPPEAAKNVMPRSLPPPPKVWDPKRHEEAERYRKERYAGLASKIALDIGSAKVKNDFRRAGIEKQKDMKEAAKVVLEREAEIRRAAAREEVEHEQGIKRRHREERQALAQRNARTFRLSGARERAADLLLEKQHRAEDSRQRQWDEWVEYRNRNAWSQDTSGELSQEAKSVKAATQLKQEVKATHEEFQGAISAAAQSRERWQNSLIKNHSHMKHRIVYGAGDISYIPEPTPELPSLEEQNANDECEEEEDKVESQEEEGDEETSNVDSQVRSEIEMIDVAARRGVSLRSSAVEAPKRPPAWGPPPPAPGNVTPYRKTVIDIHEKFQNAASLVLSDKIKRNDAKRESLDMQLGQVRQAKAKLLRTRTQEASALRRARSEAEVSRLVTRANAQEALVRFRVASRKLETMQARKEKVQKRRELVEENYERMQAITDLQMIIATLQHRLGEKRRDEHLEELNEKKKDNLTALREKNHAHDGRKTIHAQSMFSTSSPSSGTSLSAEMQMIKSRQQGSGNVDVGGEDGKGSFHEGQQSPDLRDSRRVVAFNDAGDSDNDTDSPQQCSNEQELNTPVGENQEGTKSRKPAKTEKPSKKHRLWRKVSGAQFFIAQMQNHNETNAKKPGSAGSAGSENRPASASDSDSVPGVLKARKFEEALQTYIHKNKISKGSPEVTAP
eukprot:gnl/MRDRNA2_/MRDRNA2_113114_c0_seq1.p1 gnl/MRDRNA2_/MRDRNA2_113114_c0~~gnl/MRDRNA2_/MRDRNA2_113114_c0_seq1.p1  ORF type:complete len:700 (-),score=178.15 gnl/MRDRNA2_/MRDRNA2_113114_c0_seq1:113-2212(-)